jgi:hypothetical protein
MLEEPAHETLARLEPGSAAPRLVIFCHPALAALESQNAITDLRAEYLQS